MDAITLKRIELLHPKLRSEALEIYKRICAVLTGPATCRYSYTLRTFAEQNTLYNQGRTTPGPKVTNARGGFSFHNYGLAIDIVLIINGKEASWDTLKDFDHDGTADWMECVKIFKEFGWTWGADWDNDGKTKAQGDKDERLVDAPHFQKTFRKTEAELLVLYQNHKVDKQGYVLI